MDTLSRLWLVIWPWLRWGLWNFGLLCIGCIIFVNHQFKKHHPNYGAPVAVSPVASKLAAQFSPGLQALARVHQAEIIDLADGTIQRFAAKQVFPTAVKAIPLGVEIGCDSALTYLDTLKASEVAGLLVDHANAKGQPAHWSLRAAAEANR